jgi:hypothetical protein
MGQVNETRRSQPTSSRGRDTRARQDYNAPGIAALDVFCDGF